jgi:peroxiredoxin
MAALETPTAQIGWSAPDFKLLGIDGKTYSLNDVKGSRGTLVMFICNHCPFVKAIASKIKRDSDELKAIGINTIAIMSNDVENYPEDSFDNMKAFAAANGFNFPYVYDETQAIAKLYDAVCTPDFFGFDADLKLQYRGRLDESRTEQKPDAARELFQAMKEVAETGHTAVAQKPSIGCNIKWKQNKAA